MKKILMGVLGILLAATPVNAQEMTGSMGKTMIAPDRAIMPPPMLEQHNFTYVVKDDGAASVWLRVDNVSIPLAGGEFRYTLPDKASGTPKFWYRENGCQKYTGELCTLLAQTWVEGSLRQEGRTVIASIPKRNVSTKDEAVQMSVGLYYSLADVTAKNWWGRSVHIENGTTESYVQHMSLGVFVPKGLHVRDTYGEPMGWGNAMTSMLSRPSTAQDEKAGWSQVSPVMFDFIGGGDIWRYRPNIAPGEVYSFSFMASSSVWKLYYKEVFQAIAWVLAITVVLTLLLHMVIGKKPLKWYAALMGLLFILFILVGGLWFTSRTVLWSARPDPLKYDTKAFPETAPAVEPTLAPDAIEVPPAPPTAQ